MSFRCRITSIAALTAIAVGACGDGAGPGGDFTEEEAAAMGIGVLGRNGFDAGASTVSEATGAFFIDFDSPHFVRSFDREVAAGGVLAFSRVEPTGAEITECTVATGSMQGSLGYVVNRLSGSGPATFTQAQDLYDLPAVRLVLTVDYGAATARGAR